MNLQTLITCSDLGLIDPWYGQVARGAKSIAFPECYREKIGRNGSLTAALDKESALWQDCFVLPHPVTAITDRASCVILIDTQENAVGLAARRIFIECATDCEQSREESRRLVVSSNVPLLEMPSATGVHTITMGMLDQLYYPKKGETFCCGILAMGGYFIAPDFSSVLQDMRGTSELGIFVTQSAQNAVAAIEELGYLMVFRPELYALAE